MSQPASQWPILLTARLVLVPTPLAIALPSYVAFYAAVVSDGRVTGMAWGAAQPDPVSEEQSLGILRRKNDAFWAVRGFGDCGVAALPDALADRAPAAPGEYVVLESAEVERLVELDRLNWVGYAGIRDASAMILEGRKTYLEAHARDELPDNAADGALPPWPEMVEIKYGFHPDAWGKGFATEVVRALHAWGIDKFGVRRFLGVTKSDNVGSRGVLQKVGYVAHDKVYWWQYAGLADEWVLQVQK